MSLRSITRPLLMLSIAALPAALASCDAGQAAINAQISQALGSVASKPFEILLINQTGSDLQLDVTIDGTQQTLICSAVVESCPTLLSTCPTNIQAVQQRTIDEFGRFVGGRNFNNNAAFTFTRPDEFDCTNTIVYKFTATDATAFKI